METAGREKKLIVQTKGKLGEARKKGTCPRKRKENGARTPEGSKPEGGGGGGGGGWGGKRGPTGNI